MSDAQPTSRQTTAEGHENDLAPSADREFPEPAASAPATAAPAAISEDGAALVALALVVCGVLVLCALLA